MGRLADGWISYVVTPERYRKSLETIAAAASEVGREIERFGTGHLLFVRIDDRYGQALDAAATHLSHGYAMDFREPAKRYTALGRAADVTEGIGAYRRAGLRHVILDTVGPLTDHVSQLKRLASEVRPLL